MYITPVELDHMSANIPDVCTECLEEKDTLFKMNYKIPYKCRTVCDWNTSREVL